MEMMMETTRSTFGTQIRDPFVGFRVSRQDLTRTPILLKQVHDIA